MPHLDAAYNLARWLTRDASDADDVVQEAYLRAFEAFGSFRGESARAWLLTIVRNTCYSWLGKNRGHEAKGEFDEALDMTAAHALDPATILLRRAEAQEVRQAVEELPVEFREVVILRDLEGLSYKEVADITGCPMGTVMSRLSRGRSRLKTRLAASLLKEVI